MPNVFTRDTVRPVLAEIDKLRAQGMQLKAAIRSTPGASSMTMGKYYRWKELLDGPVKASTMVNRLEHYREIVDRVDRLRAANPELSILAATKELGIHFATYYTARNVLQGKEKKTYPKKRRKTEIEIRRVQEPAEQNQPLLRTTTESEPARLSPVKNLFCPNCGLNQAAVTTAYQAVGIARQLGYSLNNNGAQQGRFPGLRYCCQCGFDLLPAFHVLEAASQT